MMTLERGGAESGRGLKALLVALLAAAGLLLAPAPAAADSNPANDSDAVTVRITPAADLGVEIDTANVTLDLTLAMGATAYTLKPATVTIVGNITPQELDVQGAVSSSGDAWLLDSDETPAIDEVQVYALFSVGRSSQPAESDFAGTKNLVTTSAKRAGASPNAAVNGNFENNDMAGSAEMDNIPLGGQRQLWLRVDVPPTTSTTSQQDVTINLTATRSPL